MQPMRFFNSVGWLLVVIAAMRVPAMAQWELQESHATAGLRGIHAVDESVAWASGTEGTVLRTLDGGAHWQRCATPPQGEKLDFRAAWAWSAQEAMVMSAGPGELSRVYKTSDGCAHWTEVRRNEDKDGFWDGMVFAAQGGENAAAVLIGDPVGGRFHTETREGGKWVRDPSSCEAKDGEAAFAASNSSVVVFGARRYVIGTGGKSGARVLISQRLGHREDAKGCLGVSVPMAGGSESAGVFSLAFRDRKHGVAVGGDYKKPSEGAGTAAWTRDGGLHWMAATKPPHGYRSSVAWDSSAKAWVAAGTNGSDISYDDGKTWKALDDGNWNAISLPYVVGPGGRIGKLKKK